MLYQSRYFQGLRSRSVPGDTASASAGSPHASADPQPSGGRKKRTEKTRRLPHLEVVREVEVREDVDEAQPLRLEPRGDPPEQLLVVLHVLPETGFPVSMIPV